MEIYTSYSSGARLRTLGHLTLAPIPAAQGTAVPTGSFAGSVTSTTVQMDDVQVPPRGQPL